MESASQGGNPATASVKRVILIVLISIMIIIMILKSAVFVAVRSIIMSAMEHAHTRVVVPAMENVLKDGLIVEISAAVKSTIMTAMELAPPSTEPAMESVLRDYLIAADTATLNHIGKKIFIIVMMCVPQRMTPAMESVITDMLRAIDIATLKTSLTNFTITVEARDNALAKFNHATGPAPREQQSVETICASAVMMTLTVIITATITENATANASNIQILVTRLAPLDTITAFTPIAVHHINSLRKDALKKVPLMTNMNIAMTAMSVSGLLMGVLLNKTVPVNRSPTSLHHRQKPPPLLLW